MESKTTDNDNGSVDLTIFWLTWMRQKLNEWTDMAIPINAPGKTIGFLQWTVLFHIALFQVSIWNPKRLTMTMTR